MQDPQYTNSHKVTNFCFCVLYGMGTFSILVLSQDYSVIIWELFKVLCFNQVESINYNGLSLLSILISLNDKVHPIQTGDHSPTTKCWCVEASLILSFTFRCIIMIFHFGDLAVHWIYPRLFMNFLDHIIQSLTSFYSFVLHRSLLFPVSILYSSFLSKCLKVHVGELLFWQMYDNLYMPLPLNENSAHIVVGIFKKLAHCQRVNERRKES